MSVESQAMFLSPQDISGLSQQNSVAGFSWTTEESGDIKKNNTHNINGSIQLTWMRSASAELSLLCMVQESE